MNREGEIYKDDRSHARPANDKLIFRSRVLAFCPTDYGHEKYLSCRTHRVAKMRRIFLGCMTVKRLNFLHLPSLSPGTDEVPVADEVRGRRGLLGTSGCLNVSNCDAAPPVKGLNTPINCGQGRERARAKRKCIEKRRR